MKKWVTALVCSLFLSSATTYAATPDEAPGGANRTALIYSGYAPFSDGVSQRNWKAADFQPYITYMVKDPQTGKLTSVNTKMFDTFLFLSPWASNHTDSKGLFDISGMYLNQTQGNKVEWQAWLDDNFIQAAQLDALAKAVHDYAQPLTPGFKAKVIMMMPYPSTTVTAWDKGISFQDNTNNRLNAVKWFIQSFLSRYNAGTTSFDHRPLSDYLDLTGFYWMKENFSDGWQTNQDNILISEMNSYIDSLPPQNGKELRSYVIPYMSSEAYSARVKPWGFDLGWIQPSHYFRGTPGDTSLLAQADNWANKYGLGVEVEADWQVAANSYYLKLLRDYLDFGSQNGWMAGPVSFYGDIDQFGTTTVDYLSGNTDKPNDSLRPTYDDLYLFLNDKYNPQKLSSMTPVSQTVRNLRHNTHMVQLQAGTQITIDLDSYTGNADLYLLDENLNPLARSFRLNGYRDEISYVVPKTGTYYVRVFGTGDSQYTATLTSGLQKTGYSPSTALDENVGNDLKDRVKSYEDRIYKVSLQQGQTYTVTAKPGSTVQDVDLYVYASPINDDGSKASYKGIGGAEQIAYTADKTGDYYVMVRGGRMDSDYDLQVQQGLQPAPEDGYQAETGFSLPTDTKHNDQILKDQTLWYKVPVEQDKTYTMLMTPQSGLDVDIDLYSSPAATANAHGDLSRSDRGPGIPDAVVYTAKETGNVYVKAKSFGEGSFEIKTLPGVQLPAGYTPDNPIQVTGTQSYQVNKGDFVYYSVPTEPGKDYLISLIPNSGTADANIEAFSSSSATFINRIGASFNGAGKTEQIVVRGQQSGSVLLKVSGVTETRYTLQVQTPGADGSSPLNGKSIQAGETATGVLAQGQAEYVKVWLDKGIRYQLQAVSQDSQQDVDLDVYQSSSLASGSLIGSSHGPTGYLDQVIFTPLTSGFYYVKVQGYTNVQYQLQVTQK